MLPTKLGISTIMTSGEARSIAAAYQLAVVDAIAMIRERKARE
jgi:hypothetical protein